MATPALSPLFNTRRRTALLATAVTSILCGAAAVGSAHALAETTPSCSLYASTSGSDSNSGSSSAPLRTVAALIKRVQAGHSGCLASGQTFNESVTLRAGETHGAEGAPVTITSVNPETPAVVNGRFVTQTGADWLTFTHLTFTWNESGVPSPTVGSKHTTWTYDDISAPQTICFSLINSSWGIAENTLIEHDRIHNCGSLDNFVCNENTTFCSTKPNDGFYLHGVYVAGGRNTTIRNNYIYKNADRGVQVRSGSNGVIIEHNVIDRNGEGIIFGDGATNVTAKYNIITNSHSPCGEKASCYDYAASEYNAVAPNLLANNDAFGNQCAYAPPACWPNQGNIETMSNVTVTGNVEVDPQYVNGAEANYTLLASSPVLGYGPDTAQPAPAPPALAPPAPVSAPSPHAVIAKARAHKRRHHRRHHHRRHHHHRHHHAKRRHTARHHHRSIHSHVRHHHVAKSHIGHRLPA
jgi:Right handed beta helix region